jgi:hypothetical protein
MTCPFGRPLPVDPEWSGPDHCSGCHRFTNEGIAEAATDPTLDDQGYTASERKAQEQRRLERGRLW